MVINNYLEKINRHYKSGQATEHTYRGDLAHLIKALAPDILVTNEPKRQSCGAPDYILTRKDIPIGFIEAKDIGDKDLLGTKKAGNKEQFDRYKASLNNLIFTDYINFHLYREGELITTISIAEITPKGIKPLPDNFGIFESLIKDFCNHVGQTIKSPKKLAEMMAGKARLLSDIIAKALSSDEANQEDSTLKEQLLAFKDILIHDITPKGFADVYAQTIAYGMFAARLHDTTLKTFTRQEAAELIPKSNPFLRKLFGYIAGPDIDDRIKWVVENLAEIFLACNVEEILKNYGKSTKMEDPIIHFYETFLSEYDPKLRKARGVWYTPQPVVNFIIRAVDDTLKREFDLPLGLSDTSKTTIKIDSHTRDKRTVKGYKQMEQEVHKVQILDPATGTGTFLAEVVKHIHKKFQGQQGIWSNYVEKHLLPRLNGFELLMASYAMAHLKLDLLLSETGFNPTSSQRLRVYLTNSLEEHHPDTGTLFANWLSTEANEANYIKRDTPVMCIIGNPPYSGVSSNNGEWINSLIEDYKYVDGIHFNERKHWLNDDYVKFLRYGQHFIEKNGSGILAYINPHGFLDNPTFRGMRWNLLKTYDKIYTIDLHGNSKKKETAPDGSADINVFDIQQGVSINIFIKTGQKKSSSLGKVYHFDLFGKRELKHDFLLKKSLKSIDFKEIKPTAPYYFFLDKNESGKNEYDSGFKLNELFIKNSMGLVSASDTFNFSFSEKEHRLKIRDILGMAEADWRSKYDRPKDAESWKYEWAKKDALDHQKSKLSKISYRPFDIRFSLYTGNSGGLYARPMHDVMRNFYQPNLAICSTKNRRNDASCYFVTKHITDKSISSSLDNSYIFPLYIYPKVNNQETVDNSEERNPNFNAEIIKRISDNLGLTFTNEQQKAKGTFSPIDLLDYIYAILHSPNYREQNKAFLKTDFPRIPYPNDRDIFLKLVRLGSEIRQIHLLESPAVEQYSTQYPVDGDNTVAKPNYKGGKVYINETQYFDNIPKVVWETYIGGYQPAQKWLKDRKDRKLEFEDILHYQKIIAALSRTDSLMKEIDHVLNIK